MYGNEEAVGAGLTAAFAEGIVRREDVFVITKIWCTYQTTAERVQLCLEKSLAALGLEYVDLLLVVSFSLAVLQSCSLVVPSCGAFLLAAPSASGPVCLLGDALSSNW